MVAAFKETTGVWNPDTVPELLLRVGHTAVAEAASVWARELNENTRDPACPAEYFPQLDKPTIAHTTIEYVLDAEHLVLH
jgi:hypothetical protein